MTEAIDIVVSTREGAHKVATLAYERARQLIADGKEVRIRAEEAEDDRTLRQNRFMWGVVLKEIAEQARVGDDKFIAEAWHELFKRQFLGYRIEKVRIAGRKRMTVRRVLRSTSDLKVKPMAKYLDQLMAFATTDLGVVFSETNWETYRGR